MRAKNFAQKSKKVLLIVVANVLPILVILFLADLYLQKYKGYQAFKRNYPGQYENGKIPVWAKSDSILGWTATQEWMPPEINAQGFRDTKDFDGIDLISGKKRIMILGDSFTFGFLLKADENIPSLLQAKLNENYDVFNFGMNGFGIDQMYLAYLQYKDIIDPHIVILNFIDDDALRVIDAYRFVEQLNKPSFTVIDEKLVPRTCMLSGQRNFNEIMSKSILFSFLMREIYFFTEAKPVVNHLFREMDQDINKRGGKFVVMRIPTPDNDNALEKLRRWLYNIDSNMERSNITYLDPVGEIKKLPNWKTDYYFSDGHINAKGNEFLADYLLMQIFSTN
ncbi:SGNH/GDSL hydrolase family protein [candidate division KSB1 bacterium]|nr:SGNH/GDSL hydrolase family protein [candidate division KSB1 bacterium]